MKKFKLTHIVLYAKGWYKQTDDILEDLKSILKLDDYTPFCDSDVYSILLNNVEKFDHNKFSLSNVLQGITPRRSIMNGYKFKEGEYSSEKAFIYYVISTLTFIDNKQWDVKIPRYTKYPKAEHVTVRKVYDMFIKSKILKQ